MMRLFVAIPIPDEAALQIGRLQSGLEGARWSPRENLHVTLRFVGDVDHNIAKELDDQLATIRTAPFELDVANVGFFGGSEPHAVWLGVTASDTLVALHKQCERACRNVGLAPDPRAYSPHLTICYLPRRYPVSQVIAFQQANNLFTPQKWTADRFYLYSSAPQGRSASHYCVEAEYPLLL